MADLGEIPWQLYIAEPSRGAASLINDRWAVTAAHVVATGTDSFQKVHGGLVDASQSLREGPDKSKMTIDRIIIHPDYVVQKDGGSQTNYDHDIALIRMASRVKLGPNLLPVCLPLADGELKVNQLGTISGWGKNDRNVERPDIKTRFLHHTPVKVLSIDDCKNTPDNMVFTANMFCAGDEGKDSCREDSGGPFVSPSLSLGNEGGSRPYRLMGIVSWGSHCSERMYQGYYTKVQNYIPWIQSTIDTVEREKR
ncbi:calcium-dependent serine proteinase [Aplochiton taeniatus]